MSQNLKKSHNLIQKGRNIKNNNKLARAHMDLSIDASK